MNAQEAIQTLIKEYNTEAIDVLTQAVRPLCETSTVALDTWIGCNEFDYNATPESIAKQWDEFNCFTRWQYQENGETSAP